MTVLTIRAHQRFAVKREAAILRDGRKVAHGLLVELSRGGCRLGGLSGAEGLLEGERVTLHPEGAMPFSAQVRWTVNGTLGFKLDRPFRIAELDRLLQHCRTGCTTPGERAYGT